MNWRILENMVTICAITARILGVWWMGGGGWGFVSFLLLTNISTRT